MQAGTRVSLRGDRCAMRRMDGLISACMFLSLVRSIIQTAAHPHRYEWSVNGYIIPYHRACYHILEKAIASSTGAPVDVDVLYGALRRIAASHPEIQAAKVLPGIDYGEAARAHRGGWWWPRQGYETYTWDPTDIPELRAYYAEMPVLQEMSSGFEQARGRDPVVRRSTSDPFASLPTNVLHSILHPLPISSVGRLRRASPAIARITLSNTFWASKIHHDMPWLYDLPDNVSPDLDWASIYQHLWLRSQHDFPFQMRGLVNRRRIWAICAQIAQPYATAEKTEEERRRPPCPILDDVVASPLRPLCLPRVLAPRMGHLLLVDEMEGFARSRPTFTVFWSGTGALAGFESRYINSKGRETTETVGATDRGITHNEVRIANDDWLRGFIATSHAIRNANGEQHRSVIGLQVLFLRAEPLHLGTTAGDQRLLHAEGDHLLVGLTAQWDRNEISALSLLQAHPQPHNTPAHTLSNVQTHHPYAHTTIGSKLWKEHLPPPTHLITERQPDFWPDGFDPHLEPMEYLPLGETDADLASITALSVDVYLGGIQIQYSNRPSKRIGPRLTALKTLPIDGRSGERIAAIIVHGANNYGLTVLTNRHRQLLAGSRVGGTHYFVPGDGQYMTGLYGAWNDSNRLQWISITFSSPSTISSSTSSPFPSPLPSRPNPPPTAQYDPPPTLSTPPTENNDNNSIPWDISPPKPHWTPKGPAYGTHTWISKYGGFENECPSPRTALATFLDCSRGLPLERVRVVFAHPTRRLVFSPVGIGLVWGGGGVDFVGVDVTSFSLSTAVATTTGDPSSTATSSSDSNTDPCPCKTDTQSPLSQEQKTQPRHFFHEEWIVNPPATASSDTASCADGSGIGVDGNGYLHSIRLWTKTAEAGGPLLGFQFVCTGAAGEGPCWGVCGGMPSGVILFGNIPSFFPPSSSSTTTTTTTTTTSPTTTKSRESEDKGNASKKDTEEEKEKAVGLKIFIDENDRPGVEDPSLVDSDPVMVCFQGLFDNK